MSRLHYVAIGDSLTKGLGAAQGNGFVERYQWHLQQCSDQRLTCVNAGISGERSIDLWKRLINDQQLQRQIAKAHIMTITTGGNDLLQVAKKYYLDQQPASFRTAMKTFRRHVNLLLSLCRHLHRMKQELPPLYIMNLYNPFPDFQEATDWIMRYNQFFDEIARKYAKVFVVPIYESFLGKEEELISEDLVHPNDLGHQVLTERLWECYTKYNYSDLLPESL